MDGLRRPSNVAKGSWVFTFPVDDAQWNLRFREVVFAMLNPTHQALRDAEIFLPAEPPEVGTLLSVATVLRQIKKWAGENEMPFDLNHWDSDDWSAFIDESGERVKPKTLVNYVNGVRWLHTLASILTGGGIAEDPWDGMPASQVVDKLETVPVSTPPIPPNVWWPLLRATWSYIHIFGPELLELRDKIRDEIAQPGPAVDYRLIGGPMWDAALRSWLDDPAKSVPVSSSGTNEPVWRKLSFAITDGARDDALSTGTAAGRRRREMVLAALRAGAVTAEPVVRGQPWLGFEGEPAVSLQQARLEKATRVLRDWLVTPGNRVPVHPDGSATRMAGEVAWQTLAKLVFGHQVRLETFFSHRQRTGLARRQIVLDAIASGTVQTELLDGIRGHRSIVLDSSYFTVVTRLDGSQGPWRETITNAQLDDELRMLQAAIYLFTAALSMMRDSEIQEIERGALTTHYGSPALKSHKTKHDTSQAAQYWWIIEPVAEAIAIAERLSWHPTHVFATSTPPRGRKRRGRRGIYSRVATNAFITHVNANRDHTGLEAIAEGVVKPHRLRRTMAVIAGKQPDGEIALGYQLKHVARRAVANRVTGGYYQPDAAWAKELDDQLEIAAAAKLTALLRSRELGENVAVGPGATRLHAGLDKVLVRVGEAQDNSGLQAQVMDDRTLTVLLREEFPELRWGTLNHCLWDANTAECQNSLPPELRGQGPMLGMCQPAKCRNSVITKERHGPVWLAEELDLTARLKDKKLAPLRRADLQARLEDVRAVTAVWKDAS
jgi:hypothetical protein